MLDQNAVLEHAYLGAVAALPNGHHAVDGLTTREELGLGDHKTTPAVPALLATFAAALLLGFEAGRALDALNAAIATAATVVVVAGLANANDSVRRIVRRPDFAVTSAATAATTTAAAGRRALAILIVAVICVIGWRAALAVGSRFGSAVGASLAGLSCVAIGRPVAVGDELALAALAATATAAATTAPAWYAGAFA
ncbi:MAG TPA: hypothetical protein VIJ96_17790 [Acidothermaceae bacterium]